MGGVIVGVLGVICSVLLLNNTLSWNSVDRFDMTVFTFFVVIV